MWNQSFVDSPWIPSAWLPQAQAQCTGWGSSTNLHCLLLSCEQCVLCGSSNFELQSSVIFNLNLQCTLVHLCRAGCGVGWFWEILELIRAADVGPAEQQGKRTQFTDILESTPDFTLKCSFKDWRNIEALACSRYCDFMKSNSLRHEIQFPKRHISNLIQLTVHLSRCY